MTITVNADGSFAATIGGRVGDEITIVVTDAAGNVSVPVTVLGTPKFGKGTAYVRGRVVNAATGQPVPGVGIRSHSEGVGGATGPDGTFVVAVPGGVPVTLFFEKDGYITSRRDTYVRSGGDGTVGDVALRAWDPKSVLISAALGGSFTDSTGNVEVYFPPGALKQDLLVRASYLPDPESFPLPVPGNFVYLGGVQMGPEHVEFNAPVTLRIRNVAGLAPGTRVPFFFASHDPEDENTGFYDPGAAEVTADGQFLEAKVMHFSCVINGFPAPQNGGIGGLALPRHDNQDECNSAGVRGTSEIGYCNGNLKLQHRLLPVYAFGENDSPSLAYNSRTADPRPVLSLPVDMGRFFGNAPQADYLETEISIEGLKRVARFDSAGAPGVFNFQWTGANGRGKAVATGVYPVSVAVANVRRRAAGSGGSGGVNLVPRRDEVLFHGPLLLNDQRQSPFGAGWGLAELETLYLQADGNVLRTRGDGSAIAYYPVRSSGTDLGSWKSVTVRPGARWVAAAPGGGTYVGVADYGQGAALLFVAPDGSTRVVASGLDSVSGIAVAPTGDVYVGGRSVIRKVSPTGTVSDFAALPFVGINDLAVSPAGELYVLDSRYGRIAKVAADGSVSMFYDAGFGLHGVSLTLIPGARSMAFDRAGNLYVTALYGDTWASCGSGFVSRFDQMGNHSYYFVGLDGPQGIAVDDDGTIYVADYDCENPGWLSVKSVTPDGRIETAVEAQEVPPYREELWFDVDLAGQSVVTLDGVGGLSMIPYRRPTDFVPGPGTVYRPAPGEFSRLERTRNGTWRLTSRDGTTRIFDSSGRLVETRLPEGRFWRYTYDGAGRLLTRTNAAGQVWYFSYAAGLLTDITDPVGRKMLFTHDGEGNLTQVQLPDGSTMRYAYDARHKIVEKTDSRGFTTVYTYGAQGNVRTVLAPTGELRRFDAARYRITAGGAGSVLPSPEEMADIYIDGRGNKSLVYTNSFGSAIKIVDALGNVTLIRRNRHNLPTRIDLPDGRYVQYSYALGYLPKQILYGGTSSAVRADITYGANARITSLTLWGPLNRYVLNVSYDDRSNPIKIQLGSKVTRAAEIAYDQFGMPLSVTIGGLLSRYVYDTRGLVVEARDGLGNTTRYSYDEAGQLVTVENANQHVTRMTYDVLGRLSAITDPLGNTVRMVWQTACATCGTAEHLLREVVTPGKGRLRFDYDAIGQLVAEHDANGNTTAYQYDLARNLIQVDSPNGSVVKFVYDPINRLIRKEAGDDTVNYTYDVSGRLTTAENNSGTVTIRYDDVDRITNIGVAGPIMAEHQLEYTTYRIGGLTTKLFDGSGGQSAYWTVERNDLDEWAAQYYGGTDYVQLDYRYDTAGRRAGVEGQFYSPQRVLMRASKAFQWDAAFNLLGLDGRWFDETVQYTYDNVGNLVAALETSGSALTQPDGVTVDRYTITADAYAVTGMTRPGFQVDINGTPMVVDATGAISGTIPVSLGRNVLNVTVRDQQGAVRFATSTTVWREAPGFASGIGRLHAVAPDGTAYFTDNGGAAWMVQGGVTLQPAWLQGATDIAVDGAGRVYLLKGAQVSVYSGGVEKPVVDISPLQVQDMEVTPDGTLYLTDGSALYAAAGGTLTQVAALPPSAVAPGGSGGRVLLDASSYGLVVASEASGEFFRWEPTSSTLVPLVRLAFWWDFAVNDQGIICSYNEDIGPCVNPDGSPVLSLGYGPSSGHSIEFDATGAFYEADSMNVYQIASYVRTPLVTNLGTVGGTLTITAGGDLSTFESNYAYDEAERLVGSTSPLWTQRYRYDGAGNRLADARGNDFTYDAADQLLSGGGVTYTYDANGNRLTKTDAGGTTRYTWDAEDRLVRIDKPDGSYAEYAYDAFGRRVQKRVVAADGAEVIRRYAYDGEDIVAVYDGTGTLLATVAHGPGIDEPLVLDVRAPAQVAGQYFLHGDRLGSIIAVTDQSGQVVQRYRYDPWGNVVDRMDPEFDARVGQFYGFTGREYDAESGLYYYRARYYDPQVGRFLSRDPIGLAGGLNTYAYVGGNPVNRIDPLGLYWWNRPPPATVPVTGQTAQQLQCVENCLNANNDWNGRGLLCTGGKERAGHSQE